MNEPKKVILAEDDRFPRRASAAALSRSFSLLPAEDDEQTLELARRGRPDLILLDLLMPTMSGIEVLSALRLDEATRCIPVVILPNSSLEIEMHDARELGGVDYLVKANSSPQAVGERVVELLGRKRNA